MLTPQSFLIFMRYFEKGRVNENAISRMRRYRSLWLRSLSPNLDTIKIILMFVIQKKANVLF